MGQELCACRSIIGVSALLFDVCWLALLARINSLFDESLRSIDRQSRELIHVLTLWLGTNCYKDYTTINV